ncbi:hypothetical protein MA16_Dca018716 [Dendrobium catenatum]|uniref:Uncharacterized protein n=1 Tax=Dendrobium catenatum TaxID=906689 RepID=A0A2I0VUY3_9ASPA|nr:hypothetical protein MA16_Dca018716 [Dendrobium catenatum]
MAVSDDPGHDFGDVIIDSATQEHYPHRGPHFPVAVKQRLYRFDGLGNYFIKDWDLSDGTGDEFHRYHIELPKRNHQLAQAAEYLNEALCLPFRLHDILTLVSNSPFVDHIDGALVFRVNSPGPVAMIERSVITVSLGRVPRLEFSPAGRSLLSEIPSVEEQKHGTEAVVIPEHVLEFLLTMNHSEEGDNPVPKRVSNLLVHIIDTHVDHIQDIVTKLEMELDIVELDSDKAKLLREKKKGKKRVNKEEEWETKTRDRADIFTATPALVSALEFLQYLRFCNSFFPPEVDDEIVEDHQSGRGMRMRERKNASNTISYDSWGLSQLTDFEVMSDEDRGGPNLHWKTSQRESKSSNQSLRYNP